MGVSCYDYGARFYDPSLGRFHTLDPLASKYSFQSPFIYAGNDPIKNIDFWGLGPVKRIEAAKSILNDDTRTYAFANIINLKTKYSDTYVDCSEYAREIALKDGYDPGEYTGAQMDYYKKDGEWETNFKNVRLGDFIFWEAVDEKGVTYYHTGVVTDEDEDGNFIISQATVNGGDKKSLNNKYKTNSKGGLWKTHTFIGAGRPKGDTYTTEEPVNEITVTVNGKSKVESISTNQELQNLVQKLLNEQTLEE